MTYPGNGEGPRPSKQGTHQLTPVADGIGRCAACRAIYVPTFLPHDDATLDQGICRLCIWDLTAPRRRIAVRQCTGCHDAGPVIIIGNATLCPFCVTFLERSA
jgi:hypothetical protein